MKPQLPVDPFNPIKTSYCSAPNPAGVIFKQHVDYLRSWFGGSPGTEQWSPARIEYAYAICGGHQVRSIAHFQYVGDQRIRQTVCRGVIGEPVAIKARKPFDGTKPEKSARVPDNASDVVAL